MDRCVRRCADTAWLLLTGFILTLGCTNSGRPRYDAAVAVADDPEGQKRPITAVPAAPAAAQLPVPASRTCAELGRSNLEFAEQYMKSRGRPLKVEIGDREINIQTGAELYKIIEKDCKPFKDGYIGLRVVSFEVDNERESEILRYWTVNFTIEIYRPKLLSSVNGGSMPPTQLGGETITCRQSPGWADADTESCSLHILGDLDKDGSQELAVLRTVTTNETGCRVPNGTAYQTMIYSITDASVLPYRKIPLLKIESTTNPIGDFDRDGINDYLLEYKLPMLNTEDEKIRSLPGFLLHGQPGGGFSQSDAAARDAARRWCSKPPPQGIRASAPMELVTQLLCARLWGKKAETLSAELDRLCPRAPQGAGGAPARTDSSPEPPCGLNETECAVLDGLDVCGSWGHRLVAAELPFRFR